MCTYSIGYVASTFSMGALLGDALNQQASFTLPDIISHIFGHTGPIESIPQVIQSSFYP